MRVMSDHIYMTETSPAVVKAQSMLDQVRDGKTVFTKAATGWQVIGPAAAIRRNAQVAVTKADGTTKLVRINHLEVAGEKQGVAYQLATFTAVRTNPAAASRRPNQASRGEIDAWASAARHGINGQIWD